MVGTPNRSLALKDLLILAGLLGGLALLLLQQGWLWRWDQLIYDTQLQLLSRPANTDITIIAIDEQTLTTFGRWPWRRDIHAELLDRLTDEQPRAVALDIIFAEPDTVHPEDDIRLAQAIGRNGKVVLPVLMEQARQNAIPSETLPVPLLAEQVAGMGHVHVELDPDGFARRLFLYEGLGNSYWPHLSLAMLKVAGIETSIVSGEVTDKSVTTGIWRRDQQQLIPYSGPPGHYQRLSYDQVVRGEFTAGTFRDKLVLVGVTAAGLGDALPTPVSGLSHSMPGVEVNANMLDALMTNVRITPLSRQVHILITLLMAVSPLFIYPLLGPRNNLLLAGFLISATLVISTALLYFARVWFPPVPALVAITLSYPLWSWRRLERTMEFLNQELDTLHSQRAELDIHQGLELSTALSFITNIMPIKGWVWMDSNGKTVDRRGELPDVRYRAVTNTHWSAKSHSWIMPVAQENNAGMLEVFWVENELPNENELALLAKLGEHMQPEADGSSHLTDLLQTRITQVKAATEQLRNLRRFIEDALSFMSDGVIVADAFGQILIANERAGWYLAGDDSARLSGATLLEILHDVELLEGATWESLLRRVLVEGTYIHNNAKKPDGRDLLVQIAPLRVHGSSIDALVVNLSDISNLRASERKRNELLHFLSHDLRSPLVSVLALLELATSHNPPANIQPLLARMQDNTEKTLGLAEQFLQLARAENDEGYNLTELDFVSVIWNSHEQIWGQAKSRGIRLVNEIETEDAWIMGEGSLLERALTNLLTNAIKYSPPDSTVRIRLTREANSYRCCVIDQGYGIESRNLPHLFDRFQRVENPEHAEADGAGLGLAFVDAVVTRHGGHIDVDSTPGSGSSFCFTLQASSAPTDDTEAMQE